MATICEKLKTMYTATSFEIACSTLAYHVTELMTKKAPCTFKCGLSGPNKTVLIKITIEERTAKNDDDPNDFLWDQTFIAFNDEEGKGKWAGNRCGARNSMSYIYADVLEDILKNQK